MKKKFSVLIATYNSMRTLEMALTSVRAQDYPADLIEILCVDGGSIDGSRACAERYGARVIDNPEVLPVAAKLLGLREATGDYLMHVDADEVLAKRDAISKRARLFAENPEIKMIFGEGYKNPPGIPFAARYINEFGDPFSMFYYRLSKDFRFFVPRLRKLYPICRESEAGIVFELSGGAQPILENAACANAIDLHFFREKFPDLCTKPWGPVHFFYHMQSHTRQFAITKNDPVLHHSADHWTSFLQKIRWRIVNNVFFPDAQAAGFIGRSAFDTRTKRIKKFFYLPYAFLVIPALIDSLHLMISRRDAQYILHLPLTLYTASTIVGMMVLKLLGRKPQLKVYGRKAVVGR